MHRIDTALDAVFRVGLASGDWRAFGRVVGRVDRIAQPRRSVQRPALSEAEWARYQDAVAEVRRAEEEGR